MQRADSRIHAAFETRAKELADRLRDERGISLQEIAFLLGYSQPNALYNAFRRWGVGTTLAGFRGRRQKT
jgi:AraC-like DNA-binding protein